jgi:hypothetical protein
VKVIDLENKLINSNNDNTCKQYINQYVHDLSEIFVDSAKKTLGTRITKNSKQKINNSKTHKPWFTVQCKFQRQNYRKWKRKYKRYKTKNELAAAETQYKRTLDISMSRHRKDLKNKLKTMRTKNPKEFWKILNKGKRKKQPDIPVDTFFEFYKELNQKPNQKDTPNLPEPEVQETN